MINAYDLVKENLELEDILGFKENTVNMLLILSQSASVPLTSNEKADIEQVFSEKTIELSERADRILKDQPSLSENELAIKLINFGFGDGPNDFALLGILKKAIKHLEEN
nr:chromosome partitioning protein [Enterococcus faecium]